MVITDSGTEREVPTGGFLKGHGIGYKMPSMLAPEGREGLRGVTVRHALADYIGERTMSHLNVYFLKMPFWARDVWHVMYRFIYDRVKEFYVEKPNDFFTIFPELVLTATTSTTARVHAIVHFLMHYWYKQLWFLCYLAENLLVLQLDGMPISERAAKTQKWSALRTMMKQMKGMPYDKELFSVILSYMSPLVDKSSAAGVSVSLPIWMGPEDHYFEEPIPADSTNAPNIANAGGNCLHRPLTFGEMSEQSPVTMDDFDASANWTLIERYWYYGQSDATGASGAGSLLYWLYKRVNVAKDILVQQFRSNADSKLNIMEPNNYLREFMRKDLGILMDDFDAAEVSTMVRSIPLYDQKDYFSKNYGYNHAPGPMLRSNLAYDETNDNWEFDASTYGNIRANGLYPIATPDAGHYEKSTDEYLQTIYDASGIVVTAAAPEIPYLMPYGGDAGGLTEISEDQTLFLDDDISVSHILAGMDHNLGALDQDEANDTLVEYNYLGGKYMAIRNFQRLMNNGKFWAKSSEEVSKLLAEDSNYILNRRMFDLGLFCLYYKVSPIIDPHDPFQHGVFPVLSTERVGQEGEWSDYFIPLAGGNNSGILLISNTADANEVSTTGQGDVDVDAENAWIQDHDHLGDVIGPFIGDSFDMSPNMHFARHDIARYAFTSSLDHGPCPIPAKPYTKYYPVRVRDDIVGGLDRYGAGLAYDLTDHRYNMTTTAAADNDLLAASDLRHAAAVYWDPRCSFSEELPNPSRILNFIFEGFKRVVEMTNPPAISSMLFDALVKSNGGATVVIDTAVKSILDVFHRERAERLDAKKNSGGPRPPRTSRPPKKKTGGKPSRGRPPVMRPDDISEVAIKEEPVKDKEKDDEKKRPVYSK